MIIGLGNDVQSISAVQNAVERQPRFINRILTDREIEMAKKRSGKHYYEYIAGRFSAKEAFAKATGLGIGEEITFHRIEVMNGQTGAPIMTVANYPHKVSVAISHTGDITSTVVIIEEKD